MTQAIANRRAISLVLEFASNVLNVPDDIGKSCPSAWISSRSKVPGLTLPE